MELQILDAIQTIRTPILDRLMWFITSLGSAGRVWILLAVILLIRPKTRKSGAIILTALVFDLILCNGILKNLVGRTRPFDVNTSVSILINKPRDFSFPSGHTAVSFAAVAALFFSGEKKLWKISLVAAVLIAFSRLYLYVHYPTDILGGIVVGILAGYIGYRVVDWLQTSILHRADQVQ